MLRMGKGEGGEMEEEWRRGWLEHLSITFLTPPTQCQNTAAGVSVTFKEFVVIFE